MGEGAKVPRGSPITAWLCFLPQNSGPSGVRSAKPCSCITESPGTGSSCFLLQSPWPQLSQLCASGSPRALAPSRPPWVHSTRSPHSTSELCWASAAAGAGLSSTLGPGALARGVLRARRRRSSGCQQQRRTERVCRAHSHPHRHCGSRPPDVPARSPELCKCTEREREDRRRTPNGRPPVGAGQLTMCRWRNGPGWGGGGGRGSRPLAGSSEGARASAHWVLFLF